jgi:hypothetical protein
MEGRGLPEKISAISEKSFQDILFLCCCQTQIDDEILESTDGSGGLS